MNLGLAVLRSAVPFARIVLNTVAGAFRVLHVIETADGPLVVFAASDSEFQGLARALDRPDLIEDERFRTLGDRIQNIAAMEAIINDEFAKWSSAELVERLVAEDVPAGPVHALEDVVVDPQIQHNDAIVEFDHPVAGRMRQAAPPAASSCTSSPASP